MESSSVDTLIWVGIVFCISQSAMFSGLNLALLSISRLRLEVEVTAGNRSAAKILALRQDVNLLLTTILWGNVSINVLLTLLSNSVMAGVTAFLFSTFLITFAGEIMPQAYFSRHALRMGSLLAPVLRLYQILLYPVAKPCAMILDRWLGAEAISYFKESDLHTVISKHIEADESDVSRMEGIGAMNFLSLDDIAVRDEGEEINADSIITLPSKDGRPVFPTYQRDKHDPFLTQINSSKKKWVIIVDESNFPYMVLNANAFLREAMFGEGHTNPYSYCHRPILATNPKALLGKVLCDFKVYPESEADDVIDHDLILLWSENEKRIITGADVLGRLLAGIARRDLVG